LLGTIALLFMSFDMTDSMVSISVQSKICKRGRLGSICEISESTSLNLLPIGQKNGSRTFRQWTIRQWTFRQWTFRQQTDISTMAGHFDSGHFDSGLFDSGPDISTVTVKIALFSQIFHF
jgi:hypothetical protein